MATNRHFQHAENHGLSLVGELNIYSAATVRTELLQALESRQQLEVDLEGVEDFDTAGVQVLLVLKAEAARQNKPINFVRHSVAVWEVLELLNLVGDLGDSSPDMASQEEGFQ
ncbi:STAS domain-containing protein [Pseudomonas sp. TH41]|uniref:STAS domain-containing protein n=1 Tax=Pseudomonas sp. TH41 TaxID=2796405 RepID=UPI00191431E6|nr:STAS domain-containing protein [Pseudomonas sp. TH41]MBK5351348.1 STAS domain-containing protein [Pseudomonas sp. TH41]